MAILLLYPSLPQINHLMVLHRVGLTSIIHFILHLPQTLNLFIKLHEEWSYLTYITITNTPIQRPPNTDFVAGGSFKDRGLRRTSSGRMRCELSIPIRIATGEPWLTGMIERSDRCGYLLISISCMEYFDGIEFSTRTLFMSSAKDQSTIDKLISTTFELAGLMRQTVFMTQLCW